MAKPRRIGLKHRRVHAAHNERLQLSRGLDPSTRALKGQIRIVVSAPGSARN
jgi:hypothetical protein